MYSEADLDAAVSAGILSPEAATGFRDYIAVQRASPAADEEHFRLLTGFNDIFVSIALILTLVALGWLGSRAAVSAGCLGVSAVSWGLAEYFTRRRHMALPSIDLFGAFANGLFFGSLALFGSLAIFSPPGHPSFASFAAALALIVTAGGAYCHWRRFMVPITVAAGALVGVGALVVLAAATLPQLKDFPILLFFVGGLAVFALAMYWDISDRDRKTRRSDVAFWLHLLAAPMIVHPAFSLLGLSGMRSFLLPAQQAPLDFAGAGIAVALYLALAVVALVIDRRALLVSALVYVLYALSTLFKAAGSLSWSLALTALLIGSGLLLLSALWHRARAALLALLPPALRARLPAP